MNSYNTIVSFECVNTLHARFDHFSALLVRITKIFKFVFIII